MAELSSLSLGSLFGKLREALVSFTRDIDKYIEGTNKVISKEDIDELRKHIQEKLDRNEEIEDNKKLKDLLDLFLKDREVMNMMRKDADAWVSMLDSIIEYLSKRTEPLTETEKYELNELLGIANQIKGLLRRSEKDQDSEHYVH
jgi:hypothetical protein